MRIQVAVPEANVQKPVLDAALESVTRLNEDLLREKTVPTFDRAVRKGGIKWKPEPPGQEHFDHAGVVARRGWGDCDDLAPWHAASLRHTGEDPGAKAVVYKSGPSRWHAVVERTDGNYDDPSRDAGMGKPESVRGATQPLMWSPQQDVSGMYIMRPAIAMRPVAKGWQARADMPWDWKQSGKPMPVDYAMVTLQSDPVAKTALTGALIGACRLAIAGGYAQDQHVNRMCAIADLVDGVPYEDVAACYGDDEAQAAAQVVGGLFGGLKKLAKKAYKGVKKVANVAKPLAKLARPMVKFVPGVGPIADTGLNLASKAAKGLAKKAAKSPAAQSLLEEVFPGITREQLNLFASRPDQFPIVNANANLSNIPSQWR